MGFNASTVNCRLAGGKLFQIAFCDLAAATVAGTKDQNAFHIEVDSKLLAAIAVTARFLLQFSAYTVIGPKPTFSKAKMENTTAQEAHRMFF